MNDEILRALRDNPIFSRSIYAVALIEFIVGFLMYRGTLKFDPDVGVAVFGGLPVLVLTLIQVHTTSLVQRAALVKDLASKIYTDKELSESFHALVYTYTDSKYEKFKNGSEATRKEMNEKRKEGLRYFHPNELEASEEERRLDSLLGYIDIIAYHYHRKQIQMTDIAGVLGFHLATINSRKAISEYRNSISQFWNGESKIGKAYGPNAIPLRYLDQLLDDYLQYCKLQFKVH